MNFDPCKADFERDGFAVVRQFLSGADREELVRHLDRYIREVVPTLPDSAVFYVDKARPETLKQMQHMHGDPFFREYTRNAAWSGLARALLGEEAHAEEPEWFNKPPGTNSRTPPHQDNYYFCLKPPNVLTIWLALDPVDEENGCLRYVAGSHREGIRPHGRTGTLGFSQGITDYGPQDAAREAAVYLQPGDAVVHHGNTIHRAEPNRSPTRHRRAFAMVFKGISCRRDEEAFARYRDALRQQHQALGLQT
jgi:phytanoyl-CoA hydroxylase